MLDHLKALMFMDLVHERLLLEFIPINKTITDENSKIKVAPLIIRIIIPRFDWLHEKVKDIASSNISSNKIFFGQIINANGRF